MKKLLKRCVLTLTAAVICVGLAVPTIALAATETTGVTEVAAFNNFEYKNLNRTVGDNTVNNHKLNPSSVAYGSGQSSLVWTLQNGSNFIYTPAKPISIANTDVVKVRMKASEGEQKINFVINNNVQKYETVTEKWQEFSFTGYTVGTMSNIIFNCGGWNLAAGTDYTTGAIIYIDSIWVESANVAYNKVDYPLNGANDAVAELASFNTSKTNNVTLTGTAGSGTVWTQKATTINARENGNGMYRFFTAPGLINRTTTVTTNTVNVAAGGYQYINMWVYSPRPQNGGVRIHCQNLGSAPVGGVTMNWSGWRLVSLALPNDVKALTSLQNMQFLTNEYPRARTIDTSRSVSGNYEAACTSEMQFGIESIWLSKNQPAGANEDAVPAATETLADLDTDIVIADYNKTAPGTGTNATATANSYKGGKSARSRRFGGVYLSGDETAGYQYKTFSVAGCSKEAEFTIFNDSSNPYTGIESTDYLNFWIYNPSVKYDRTTHYTEYILAIRHNAGGSFANKTFGIIANFEGWKRFSIPMSEIHSSWSTDTQIETIKITANAWLPTTANTDITKMSHEHTNKELEKGYRASSNYNAWPDVYNFFDIEKMWISKDAPAESLTGDEFAAGFNRKDIEITNMDFSLGTVDDGRFIGSVSGDGILLKGTGVNAFEVVDSATTVDSHNVTVSTSDLLDTDTSYYLLYPDIYDTAGNKYAERPTFKTTTKDLYMTAIVVDPANPASASVIYRGDIEKLHPERVKSSLIGALFDADGTLKQAKVSRYSVDNQTMTVTLDNAQEGDTVRYFLYDGANFTPFQGQVERVIGAAATNE